MDTTYIDAVFDAAMAQTGQPPFTSMFDRRALFPLQMLPQLVATESDAVLEPGRVDEIRSAGWFRVEMSDGFEGVPLFVASRVGLFLELPFPTGPRELPPLREGVDTPSPPRISFRRRRTEVTDRSATTGYRGGTPPPRWSLRSTRVTRP